MLIDSKLDKTVPGGVYLCQINEQVSCGACCGLYNLIDASFDALTEMLRRRTEAFASIPRTVNSIIGSKHATEDSEPMKRPFPDFHHCPYLGLVGKKYSRVGCLLHPQARGNNGIDFRGLSYYGGMACRAHFCPSYSQLSGIVKRVVREAAVDWYSYGLVVTEALMLSAFFLELERRLDRPIQSESLVGNEKCLKLIQKFLNLKFHWPFRPRPDPGPHEKL